jgi:hypothetical protein
MNDWIQISGEKTNHKFIFMFLFAFFSLQIEFYSSLSRPQIHSEKTPINVVWNHFEFLLFFISYFRRRKDYQMAEFKYIILNVINWFIFLIVRKAITRRKIWVLRISDIMEMLFAFFFVCNFYLFYLIKSHIAYKQKTNSW